MIFLTLVCLFPGYPAPPWPDAPGYSVLSTLLTVLFVVGHAFWVTRRISRPLARDPSLRDSLLRRYERGRVRHQVIQVAAFVLALSVLGWGWTVRHAWQHDGNALMGSEVLLLSPFLA